MSIGPGRYSAPTAMISSNLSICSCLARSCMPPDSSWKTPSVFPWLSRSNVALSSRGRLTQSISLPLRLLDRIDTHSGSPSKSSIPRKSIFSIPTASTGFIENWVTAISESLAMQTGQRSMRGSPQMIIPPHGCRYCASILPAFWPMSIRRAAPPHLSSYSALSSGSISSAFSRVILRSSGTSLAISLTFASGTLKTRPTSLIAILAFIVPKVMICATLSLPYLCTV